MDHIDIKRFEVQELASQKYMDQSAVMRYLGMPVSSTTTFKRHVHPYVKYIKLGGLVLYSVDALDEWAEHREILEKNE